MKKIRHTPPATRAPDKGPMMKDMMDTWLLSCGLNVAVVSGQKRGAGGPGRVRSLRLDASWFIVLFFELFLSKDWGGCDGLCRKPQL